MRPALYVLGARAGCSSRVFTGLGACPLRPFLRVLTSLSARAAPPCPELTALGATSSVLQIQIEFQIQIE